MPNKALRLDVSSFCSGSLDGRITVPLCLSFALCAAVITARPAVAQTITTGTISGSVADPQGGVLPGATVVAVHTPTGTTYEAVTQADGRFTLLNVRVGGPYTVTAALQGFSNDERKDIMLSLRATQSIDLTLKVASLTTTETVVGKVDPVFAANRTGAATAITREDLAVLPTVSGRMNDITRTTPQFGGGGSFAGQDNRLNNITVDGSYFNNSFGLGGQPGDRTGVAPISLEAIEQVQVSVAPYDVRQGNFVGAGINTVTRSGTNSYTAAAYSRYRNESFVGKNAGPNAFNPGTFTTKNNGIWAGGPIVRNKWFIFGSFEKQSDVRPLTTFTANPGGATVTGNMTRVLASDLDAPDFDAPDRASGDR